MIDTSTTVAGVCMETCIYNASGPRSGTSTALAKVAQSKAGAILTKSATLEGQLGNPHPRTHHADESASFNSEGLPNKGIDYYIDDETIEESLGGTAKPYFVSLSGKSGEDNLTMLIKLAGISKVALIELNVACPNVIGKPIVGYDMDQLKDILARVSKVKNLPPLGLKLPPYLDLKHIEQVAEIINSVEAVKYVAAINTIGNALVIDTNSEAPFIASNYGFAGMSGPAIKHTALANVRKLKQCLRSDIDVVGVGGVTTGQDVFAMLLVGANAVQIGTAHWKEGPACFDRIHSELCEILKDKGYSSVQDVIGRLQPWSKDGSAQSRAAGKSSPGKPGSVTGTSASKEALYQFLIAVLLVLVSILYTDKFHVKLLPEE